MTRHWDLQLGGARGITTAVIVAQILLCAPTPLHAQTTKGIVDSILGRTATGTNDLNSDSKVDVLDLVLFLNQRPIEAWFPAKTSLVNSWSGQTEVEIAFSEPVTGSLGFRLSGSAVAGGDYEQPTAQIPLTDAATVRLPIKLKPQSQLRSSRQIVITLQVPTSGVLRTGGGVNNRYSTHNVLVRDADAGLYSGTLGFYSTITSATVSQPAPAITPCALRMGLRTAGTSGPVAIFYIPKTGFLPEQIELPVVLAGDSKTFTSATPANGTHVLKELGNKPIRWKFELLPKSADNPWFANDVFQSDCLLTVEGISGSGKALVMKGKITASFLE